MSSLVPLKVHARSSQVREESRDGLPVRCLVVGEVYIVVRADHPQVRVVEVDGARLGTDVVLEEAVAEGRSVCVFEAEFKDFLADFTELLATEAENWLLIVLYLIL